MRNFIKSFEISALFAAAFLLFIGCSGNGGNNDGGNIVNAENEAWTDAHLYSAGNRDGYIIKKDGTFLGIGDYSGKWSVSSQGTWSKSGNKLTMRLIFFGEPTEITGTYKIFGDTLTFTSEGIHREYVRTPNVIIGESVGVGGEDEYTPIPEELVGRWHAMSADLLVSYGGIGFTAEGIMYYFDVDGSVGGDSWEVKMQGIKIMYHGVGFNDGIDYGWHDTEMIFEDGVLWRGNYRLFKE
jgi:hypothetical protein